MTFKEFCDWCNMRACDGFWNADIAIICCDIGATMLKVPFWKREKMWRRVNEEMKIEELYVKPTDAKIKEFLNER